MKKIISLLKACMTSDMNLFKIKQKNSSKLSKILLPLFISFCLMFSIWSNANLLFEKVAPLHLQYVILSMFVFGVSFMTIIEGIYKTSSLLFNCKDDDLLLSLPIKRKTVLFIRIFKFYIFELLFNSLFILPVIIAYIRWADSITWTFYLTSIIMLITLPIIPIIISSFVGLIISNIASRVKNKNIIQTIMSIIFVSIIMIIYFNINNILKYLINNASSINDIITKIYYPAGIYGKLITSFNTILLLKYILINIILVYLTILILSKVFFKINSRLKINIINKKVYLKKININKNSCLKSLIKKEFSIFINTPVLIINSCFSLVIFVLVCIGLTIKFDEFLPMITSIDGLNLSKDFIINNISLLILSITVIVSYMTSISSSLISLEGKNINILKSLPISNNIILISKVLFCLIITTPLLLIGNIILFIRFKISIFNSLLIIILSILIPLVSHFIGIIINLIYPKLDAENSTQIVKQSMSSLISIIIGLALLILNIGIIIKFTVSINTDLFLILFIIFYIILNGLLYLILIKYGSKRFTELNI